jgi:acyl-CoA reductase-like NAD-dependent aldehyde dehydrogenase
VIIDGKPSNGGGEVLRHIYPATGQVTGEIRLASSADVDAAVAAARQAAPAWRALTGDKRRDLMFKLAALIEQNGRHLAELSTIENGSTIMRPAISAGTQRKSSATSAAGRTRSRGARSAPGVARRTTMSLTSLMA